MKREQENVEQEKMAKARKAGTERTRKSRQKLLDTGTCCPNNAYMDSITQSLAHNAEQI